MYYRYVVEIKRACFGVCVWTVFILFTWCGLIWNWRQRKFERFLLCRKFENTMYRCFENNYWNLPPRLPQRFGRLARRMDELFRGYRFRRTVTYWISRVRQCQQWALNGSAEQTHNCFNPLELRCIDLVTNINLIFDFPTTNVHSYFYFHPPTP